MLQQVHAGDIEIVGEVKMLKPNLEISKPQKLLKSNVTRSYIKLLKLELSAKALDVIEQRAERAQNLEKSSQTAPKLLPEQVQLGMNDVPVLNQGAHGSCVVFAVTAAIDAAINKGDYVSQVCQLSLGRYIENNGHIPSGWNGALIRNILGEIELFGFVSKNVQKSYGCAGLTEYPETGEDLLNEESITEFHKYSEKLIANKVSWSSILDIFEASIDSINEDEILLATKRALSAGDRVILGAILLDYEKGVVGAQGTYKFKNDAWVLTPEMISNINNQQEYVGHALLITGYNDKAVAIDSDGQEHRGLLTLRNSWGSNIGDNGDFYMSYDYFKALVIEAQRLRTI